MAEPAAEIEEFGSLAAGASAARWRPPRARDLDWMAGLDGPARERLRLLTTTDDYLAAAFRAPRSSPRRGSSVCCTGGSWPRSASPVRQAIEAFTFFRRGIEETARLHRPA
ncbi:MAG: hypothetical protein U0531_08845 [Dehalococcoidia bacterium]